MKAKTLSSFAPTFVYFISLFVLSSAKDVFTYSSVPAYSGKAYVELHNDVPYFEATEYTVSSYETYGDLDELGRCTTATACIGRDLMPTEERGSISSIKPTGWHSVSYSVVEGGSLYNRCHLIGWQLTAENANPNNLITGTRYLNTEGMLPFENLTADYIKQTGNHVLYRVTPVFVSSELVARGVLMEAYSVEDKGQGIEFCVFCYNVQPGIEITYQSGVSREITTQKQPATVTVTVVQTVSYYVLNTSSKKFHLPDCSSASKIKDENRATSTFTCIVLVQKGYSPCSICKPDKLKSEEKQYFVGDMDMSGTVTASDARLALRGAVGLEVLTDSQKLLGDADFDLCVTASDARLILRVSVGLEKIYR